ncbi:acetyl-CoA carboxylase biotin carboxyl carrier protein subunit [Bradyrhizobium sp. MOS003]|nr:acetyl-CoA carboxylase biotin carboxyl carrier protein subunit [Bradyrhizobium sp. MOS003]
MACQKLRCVTEVAQCVCATPVQVGGTVADGDEIVIGEAMKMEMPVSSPARGMITSRPMKLDDVVAEGQAAAIIASWLALHCFRGNLSVSFLHARYGVAIA